MRKSDRERKISLLIDNKNIQNFKIGIGRECASVSKRKRNTISHYYAILTMIGLNLVQLRRVRCHVNGSTGISEPIGLRTIWERAGCVESFNKLCCRFGSFIMASAMISSVAFSLADLTSRGIRAPFTMSMTMAFIVAAARTMGLGVATTPRCRKGPLVAVKAVEEIGEKNPSDFWKISKLRLWEPSLWKLVMGWETSGQ